MLVVKGVEMICVTFVAGQTIYRYVWSVESGQSSAVADFNLLDTARKVELYGIQMHPAKVNYC